MLTFLWIYVKSISWPNGTTTNLVQKQWNIEDISKDVTIYNICPGSDTNSIYFYGDFKSQTIIATDKHAMVFDIVPFKDENDWDQDNLYFVGSLGYKVIWRYSLSSDYNNIACYNPKLEDKSIISKIVLKISDSDVLYAIISTLKSAIYCQLELQSLKVRKCEQYYSIEIYSVIKSNPILLLGKK